MSEPPETAASEPEQTAPSPDGEETMVIPAPGRRLFRRRPREESPAAPAANPAEGEPAQVTAVIGTGPASAPAPAVADEATESDQSEPSSEIGRPGPLERERRGLVDEREEAVYHLGGLAYELHRRGLLLGRAMRARAEAVAEIDDRVRAIDARLDEIEQAREARRQERKARPIVVQAPPAVGQCEACETPYPDGAHFCANCGAKLPETPPTPADAADTPAGPAASGETT